METRRSKRVKKRQIKLFIAGLILGISALSFFFFRDHEIETATSNIVSPADFIEPRDHALDLLKELVKSDFRVKDAAWEISLPAKKMEFLQLTLFAGNQYWFAVAASKPAQKLRLALYDSDGSPVALDLWKDDHTHSGARAAGGLVVARSGNYYVGIELLAEQGRKAIPASLVYAYQ